jgi:hypothetical protein
MRIGKPNARITNPEVFSYSISAFTVGTFVLLDKGIRSDALLMLGVVASQQASK